MKLNLSRAAAFLGALAVLGLVASACGGGGSSSSSDKTTTQPTAQATAATVDLSKDALGRSVTLPANPQRIVAMAPTVVEFMYAVGAKPVGRPSSADYPDDAKTIPAFGTAYQPNMEEIANMKPDLILADAIIDEAMMDSLTKIGVPVFNIRAGSFDDVVKDYRIVGAITGHKDEGEKQAKALEDKLASILAKKPTGTSPSFLIIIGGGPSQIFAAKPDSYFADVVARIGGKNVISASEAENFRFKGFSDYSMERMVQTDPDVIFAISPGAAKLSDGLASNAVWSSLKAVKEHRVYEVDPIAYLQNAGPRISKMLDELPGYLYPTVFTTGR